jgi:uncharacterized membrane-anchored protein YitT (DUF2179 family)
MKTKNQIWNVIVDFAMITVATIITGAGVFFFLMPSHLSVGSVSGLAVVLSGLTTIPVSVLTMIMNVLFLVLGFLLIGREFGAKTIYTSILLPAVVGVFETLFPNFESMTQDPFLDMVCYCFVVSIGLSLLFTRNASSGGLDIAAKILNKYLRMDLGKAMTTAGMTVAVSSILLYDTKTVILSVLGTYLNGVILDKFIFGINTKKRVCILSEKHEEIRNYIINDLHSGATLYTAVGAYDYQDRPEIVTIVDKGEYAKLMSYLTKNDPSAFVTVYTVGEVLYRPKK